MRCRLPSLVLVIGLVGCDSAPSPEPAVDPAPSAPQEPEVIAVDAIDAPAPGRANVAWPTWNGDRARFEHTVRSFPAGFAGDDTVQLIRVGEEGREAIVLSFYGSSLASGEQAALPADDSTARPASGFTVVVERSNAGLRPRSGTVTITQVGESSVTGKFDIEVRSPTISVGTRVRGRFTAALNDWLSAQLEHQRAIRQQLRRRKGR
jgi:hypothetical protein